MSILRKPSESDYGTYGDYALATIGFALVVGGGGCAHSGFVGCGAGCCGFQCDSHRSCRVVESRFLESRTGRTQGCFGCLEPGGNARLDGSVDSCADPVGDGAVSVEEDSARKGAFVVGGSCGLRNRLIGGVEKSDAIDPTGCVDCDESKSGVEVPLELPDCKVANGVAEKTLRNRQWRKEKKLRKQKRRAMGSDWRVGREPVIEARGVFSECEKTVRLDLLNSRAARFKAQNELEVLKAKREIQVLEANDVESEVKRYRTKVSSQVEKNMVAIEKTHATLIATGNVPGFAETVVDGVPSLTSGSISPDSSASQAEFRAAQKKILDVEAENARMLAAFKKLGISFEAAEAIDKQTFTDDTHGNDLYEELHPEADAAAIHYKFVDGKKKFSLGVDPDSFC